MCFLTQTQPGGDELRHRQQGTSSHQTGFGGMEEWRIGWKVHNIHSSSSQNLQYLHDAKRLNPRQAQWELFFTAGLPAWFAIHHQSTTHSSHSIGAHISGHWPPWSQRYSLVAEGSLLVFHYYGIPEHIVSDWGPQFISKVWKAFSTLLGVTVSLSSGYHPQSNGQTERKIQEVGCFLRTFCHGHQNQLEPVLGLG